MNDFTQYDLELVEQDDDFIGMDLVSLWRTCAEYVEFFRFIVGFGEVIQNLHFYNLPKSQLC